MIVAWYQIRCSIIEDGIARRQLCEPVDTVCLTVEMLGIIQGNEMVRAQNCVLYHQ